MGGPAPRLHDSATYTTSYALRGNPTSLSGGGTGKLIRYDMLGMPAEATTGNSNVKASTDKDRGYAVPKTITPNGTSQLSHGLGWNSHLGLTSDSGPNGATSSVAYSLDVLTLPQPVKDRVWFFACGAPCRGGQPSWGAGSAKAKKPSVNVGARLATNCPKGS